MQKLPPESAPMKYQTLIIKGQLATLNEHDNANRANRFGGASLKKTMTDLVALQCGRLDEIYGPCVLTFNWCHSGNHDPDNICFAKKYILDGLVKSGKLPNDNQKYIAGFGGDYFTKVEKGEEKIIVEIEEEN